MSTKNLSVEKVNELFVQLGVPVVVVDNAENADDQVDFDALVTEIRPATEQVEQVDKDKLISATTGKLMGTIYSLAAKTFGLKRSDVDGLTSDELFAKIRTISEGRYTQTEAQLRQELEAAINNHNTEVERLRGEHESALNVERERFTERDIFAHFRKEYEGVPKKGGEIDLLAEMALDRARKQHDVKWNAEKGRVEFFEKGNPEKRVINGKAELDTKSFLTDFNKALGNEATDTRHISPADVQKQNLPGGIQNMPGAGESADPVTSKLQQLAAQNAEMIAGN